MIYIVLVISSKELKRSSIRLCEEKLSIERRVSMYLAEIRVFQAPVGLLIKDPPCFPPLDFKVVPPRTSGMLLVSN